MRSVGRLTCLAILAAIAAGAQGTDEENFQVYADHPRLLLKPQRLRLLRRERERQSPRWLQFETLIKGKAQMAEPGFAWALYYQVSSDELIGRQAAEWAAGAAQDVRQIALVYDWCWPLLTDAQKKRVEAKLRNLAGTDIPSVRNRVFAAIASASEDDKNSAAVIKEAVTKWWRAGLARELKNGNRQVARRDTYALMELLHAIRDTLEIDLRSDAPRYFRDLPAEQLLTYYPAAYPAAENEFRIPAYTGSGEPDLRIATLSRAAEFAIVSFDSNATESQFLQGWLLHDRFTMMGPLGAVYEFLWANPYQPGLSYFHMPLQFHDPRTGRLFLRSSWEEDAVWLGFLGVETQMFRSGKRSAIKGRSVPVAIGDATVLPGLQSFKVESNGPSRIFVTGLEPRQRYDLEVDDEELTEVFSDAAGTLAFDFKRRDGQGVRVRKTAK